MAVRMGRQKAQSCISYVLIFVLLIQVASRLPQVASYDKELVEYDGVKGIEEGVKESQESADSEGGTGDSAGEDPSSYEEFGDHGETTDIDLDPGSWRLVLDIVPEEQVGDGEQALYVEGVKKMMDAFGKGEPNELHEAIRVLQQSASEQGNAHAQSTLAYLYGSGTGLERSEVKGFLHHYFAGEGGNCQSKMALAYNYYRQQMFDKAVQLYAELAATAMASFFSWRETPLLEPQRLNDGFEESRDALKKHRGEGDDDFQFTEFQARKGHDGRAMFKLGVFYYYGVRGVSRDHAKALSWFSKAVEKDFAPAMELLGEIYARGYGVERNFKKSFEMFSEAVRRKQWSAYNGMGYLYVKGLGVEKKDPVKAKEYFQKAADHHDINGHYNLGVLYLTGIGGKKDRDLALEHLSIAATKNHPKAFYQLAKLYQKGNNLQIAATFYKTVAERGPWSSLMRLGLDFYLKREIGKAYLFYSRAAELGYEVAQSNAAWILEKYREEDICFGCSGFCNDSERHHRAHMLWQFASEQGNEHAALLIGDAYYYGRGTKRDLERAAEAYRRAQMQQNAQAMFNLGYMHEHGLGLPMDFFLAKRYYDQARETDGQAALPVTIALMGLWLRQNYGGSILIKMIDALPEAIPAAKEWVKSVARGEGNITIATLFVCLLTVLYLRQRQRRNLPAEAPPQPH